MAHAGVDAILIPYPSHARYITLDRPSLLVQSNSKPSTATTTSLTSRPSTINTINHQHTSEHSTNHQPTCTRTLDAHPTGKPASSKPNSPRRTCEHILPPTRRYVLTLDDVFIRSLLTVQQLDSACEMDDQLYYRYDGDFAESDDGNVESQRETIALRRAASLEVLKAYGGCFASGFLALQEPLPSRPKSKLRSYESAYSVDMSRTASNATSLETASSSWSSNVDVPRPDSSTLGVPVPESKGGKWSWRSMRRSRKQAAKKIEV